MSVMDSPGGVEKLPKPQGHPRLAYEVDGRCGVGSSIRATLRVPQRCGFAHVNSLRLRLDNAISQHIPLPATGCRQKQLESVTSWQSPQGEPHLWTPLPETTNSRYACAPAKLHRGGVGRSAAGIARSGRLRNCGITSARRAASATDHRSGRSGPGRTFAL